MDKRRRDILRQILRVHAAGRDELDAAEGAGERLHCGQAAVNARREEFDDLQSQLHRRHDLSRGDAAGRNGNVVFHAPAHDLFVKAGRDDELRAGGDGLLALLERDDRARADEHLRAALADGLDGIGSGGGAERDLHHVDAACGHGLRRRNGILRMFQHHNGHNPRTGKSGCYIHMKSSVIIQFSL